MISVSTEGNLQAEKEENLINFFPSEDVLRPTVQRWFCSLPLGGFFLLLFIILLDK